MKKGRLSNDEARYITENAGKTPVEEIASFVKYIVDHPGSSFNGSIFDMNGGIF